MLAAVWAIIAAAFGIAWWTTAGILWFVAALLGALVTVMALIATFDPDTAVPGPAAKNPPKAIPRGNGSGKPRRSSPGTAGRKPHRPRCSARCRNSTKPLTDCSCVCGGKTHGIRHRDP